MADEDLDGADLDESEIDDDDGEIPWESHAREAVEGLLAGATFDEIRGVVYAPTVGRSSRGRGHRRVRLR